MSIPFRFLILPLLFSMTAFAQPPADDARASDKQVHLDVVVTGKAGPPVGNLPQQSFTVLDNKTPLTLTSFKAVSESKDPVSVIIVIDAVNTGYENIAYERQQLTKFFEANNGHLTNPTTIAIITDTGSQIQNGFTQDGKAMEKAFDGYTIGLRDLRRSSGFYGADERLQLSLKAIAELTVHAQAIPGRKIILWASPGWPLLSGPAVELGAKQQQQIFDTIVNLSTDMRRGHITLYSLDSLGVQEGLARVNYYREFLKGVTKPGQVSLGNLGLQVLAVQSGGLALNSSDLAGIMQRSLDDTKAYYELTFLALPAERKDEYHKLTVQLTDPSLTARTRTGYYAQP